MITALLSQLSSPALAYSADYRRFLLTGPLVRVMLYFVSDGLRRKGNFPPLQVTEKAGRYTSGGHGAQHCDQTERRSELGNATRVTSVLRRGKSPFGQSESFAKHNGRKAPPGAQSCGGEKTNGAVRAVVAARGFAPLDAKHEEDYANEKGNCTHSGTVRMQHCRHGPKRRIAAGAGRQPSGPVSGGGWSAQRGRRWGHLWDRDERK